MSVLIVVESYFGNTLAVARAVAAGFESVHGAGSAVVQRAHEAATVIPEGVDLVLAGAPTHLMHLPDAKSREQARERGAAEQPPSGLQEWIDAATPRQDVRVIAFDTNIPPALFSGSAAKAAVRALQRRGFRRAERGPSFAVTGTAGPLAQGAEEAAYSWGIKVAGAA